LLVVLAATVLMRTMQRRESSRQQAQPGLGIRMPELRQISVETAFPSSWRVPRPTPNEDIHAQRKFAENLAFEARSAPAIREEALQKLRVMSERMPPESPEIQRVLHLQARMEGLWGSRRFEESLETYKSILERYPDCDLKGQIYYEMGLTLELGLRKQAAAELEYKKAIAVAANELPGMLAASRVAMAGEK